MQHHSCIRLGHRKPRRVFEASVHGPNIPSSSESITKKDLTATNCTAVCSATVSTTIYQELSAKCDDDDVFSYTSSQHCNNPEKEDEDTEAEGDEKTQLSK